MFSDYSNNKFINLIGHTKLTFDLYNFGCVSKVSSVMVLSLHIANVSDSTGVFMVSNPRESILQQQYELGIVMFFPMSL